MLFIILTIAMLMMVWACSWTFAFSVKFIHGKCMRCLLYSIQSCIILQYLYFIIFYFIPLKFFITYAYVSILANVL